MHNLLMGTGRHDGSVVIKIHQSVPSMRVQVIAMVATSFNLIVRPPCATRNVLIRRYERTDSRRRSGEPLRSLS